MGVVAFHILDPTKRLLAAGCLGEDWNLSSVTQDANVPESMNMAELTKKLSYFLTLFHFAISHAVHAAGVCYCLYPLTSGCSGFACQRRRGKVEYYTVFLNYHRP